MAFTIDSKVGELLDNPETLAVLDRHIPDFSPNPLVRLTRDVPLRMVAGYSQGSITAEKLAAIGADLASLKDNRPAFSIDSKVGELLDDPRAKAILDRHIPEFSPNPLVSVARDVPLRMVAGYSQGTINEKNLAAINSDLLKL